MLGPRQTRGVVGERRKREVVTRKSLMHLPPSGHPIPRIRLSDGPKVPSPLMLRIGRQSPRDKLPDGLGPTPSHPVGTRQNDQRTRIIGLSGNNPLVERPRHLGNVAKRLSGSDELFDGG